MGSSFSVLLARTTADVASERVVSDARAAGHAPVAADAATRTIVVTGAPESDWVAISDSGAPGDDVLASAVAGSHALAVPVVAVSVRDSDIAALALALDGDVVQAVTLGPAAAPAPSPDPRWAVVLRRGHSLDELAAAWQTPLTYAEQALIAMAPLVRWGPALVGGGWATAKSALEQHAIHLGRQTVPSSQPPALGHVGGDAEVRCSPGGTGSLVVVAHSTRGPGVGLDITLWGPALDAELVVGARARATIGAPPDAAAPVTLTWGRADGVVATASWPGLSIPQGAADQRAAFAGVAPDEGVRRWLATRIEVTVELTCGQPGTRDLYVALLPAANRGGAARLGTEVTVA